MQLFHSFYLQSIEKIRKVFSKLVLISFGASSIFFSGCKKSVQVDPPKTQLINTVVFNNDASATAALTGIYGSMMQNNDFASGYTTYFAGMSADEMVDYSNLPANAQINNNAIDPSNTNILSFWGNTYNYIYAANAAIEGLQTSTSVSLPLKQELIGEAEFVRAFCTFYLVNFFGDIPLITSTGYQTNATLSRTSSSTVYQQIITDLISAQKNLPSDFANANGERIRPVSWAASALLSRVYLYNADWEDAETQATTVINNTNLFSLVSDPDSIFLANSSESIWQLQPVGLGYNTWEGFAFILTGNPSGNYFGVALNDQLVQSFEPGDLRMADWVNNYSDLVTNQIYYYPYKYKVKTGSTLSEYYTVLRLAELYLIRAEARARQNNLNGALADLNMIRNRAGLLNSLANDQASLLQAIEQERRIELFAEWGNRWLDLKRTSQATLILAPIKTGWQATDTLYPIPASERQNDPNLTQNPGYN